MLSDFSLLLIVKKVLADLTLNPGDLLKVWYLEGVTPIDSTYPDSESVVPNGWSDGLHLLYTVIAPKFDFGSKLQHGYMET